ncbi:MAG TPA: NepR family anti-sigma factor [Rhizomicrobium sp.]
MSKEKNPNTKKIRSARARQQAIGHELRRLFDSVVQEPVPNDFLDLLRKIEASEKDPTRDDPS